MSEELKATANNGTEAQKPAAPAAAAKPAAARPAVARPAAAPAKPAVNELKPKTVAAADLHAEMKRLHDEEGMDFLLNLTGEDWLEDGIGVVYQVENTENHKQACVKCVVSDRENPMIPSVCDLWDIANVYEREVYDYYGIIFTNHPDMRRLFMREDWVGYPFRKDNDPEGQPLRPATHDQRTIGRRYLRIPIGAGRYGEEG